MVRLKNRYFLVEIKYADQRRLQRNVSSEVVYKAIRQAIQDSYGDWGIGALKDSIMVKYLNPETNMVIIRARRDYYHMAQVSFTFIKKIGDYDCFLHTLYIGGTIRACQKFLIQYHRRHMPMLLAECKLQVERERQERIMINTCLSMEQAGSAITKERSLSELAGDS